MLALIAAVMGCACTEEETAQACPSIGRAPQSVRLYLTDEVDGSPVCDATVGLQIAGERRGERSPVPAYGAVPCSYLQELSTAFPQPSYAILHVSHAGYFETSVTTTLGPPGVCGHHDAAASLGLTRLR